MKYYVKNNNKNSFVGLSPQQFYQYFGENAEIQKLADDVYKGFLVIEDIDIELQETIQSIITSREERFGKYNLNQVPANELKSSLQAASFPCETRQEAKELIENFVLLRESISDEQASLTPDIFSLLKETGAEIPLGTRYKWNGKIKKAKKNCHDIKEDNPENTPDNWEDLDYEDGFRTTSSVFAKGQEFDKGDYGFKKGVLYKSKIDNNGWDPELYPDYWEIIEDNQKKPKKDKNKEKKH